MKVSELIEWLKAYDQELPIDIAVEDNDGLVWIAPINSILQEKHHRARTSDTVRLILNGTKQQKGG